MEHIENPSVTREVINYFVIFWLVAVTGLPFFYAVREFIFIGFILTGIIFILQKKRIDNSVIKIIAIFLLIEIFQIIAMNLFSLRTFIGTYTRLLYAYFSIKILGTGFQKYYIKIIYFLSIISLIFYICSFIPGFTNYFLDNVTPIFKPPFLPFEEHYRIRENIILFTFEPSLWEAQRNSGPFWEPGGFAVFLNIAFMFNLIMNGGRDKKNIIFIIAILTTVSTAGYLALFVLLLFSIFFSKRIKLKYLKIFLLLISSIYLYYGYDFLNKKVETNIMMMNETTSSRFGSAKADLNHFIKSPIIGWGRGENRYEGKRDLSEGEMYRNNGLASLLAEYGLIIFIIYFYYYYRSFKYLCYENCYNPKFSYVALLILFILGFSQGFFTRPFFYSLLFLFSEQDDNRDAKKSFIARCGYRSGANTGGSMISRKYGKSSHYQ